MSDDVFRQNKPSPGCPSALALSRYVIDDLDPDAARRIDEHLQSCPPCRTQVEREREEVEVARTAPVPPALAAAASRPRRAWLPWSLTAVAAAAAVVVLSVWILPGTTPRPHDTTRVKGALALSAALLRDGELVFEQRDLAAVTSLRAGDRLRLRVTGVGSGHLALTGCDPSGCQVLFRGPVPAGGAIPVGVRATAGESRIEVTACPDATRLDRALANPKNPPESCRRRSYPIRVDQNP